MKIQFLRKIKYNKGGIWVLYSINNMNLIYIFARVISEVEFNFIYKFKNDSIATFLVNLENNAILKIKAFDNIADYCYSKLTIGDTIVVEGKLESNMEVKVNTISKI